VTVKFPPVRISVLQAVGLPQTTRCCPLEECDRFGNPIVPGDVKSSGTNDAVSVDCHFEVTQGRGAVKMPNDTMSDPPCAPVNAPMMPNALDSIMAQLDANLR